MLRIIESQSYGSANIWLSVPSIRLLVDVGPGTGLTNNSEFRHQLMSVMVSRLGLEPRLLERVCSGGGICNVIARTALAIQNLAGWNVKFCKARRPNVLFETAPEGIYEIAFECFEPGTGMAAGTLSVTLFDSFLSPAQHPIFDFESELRKLIDLNERVSFAPLRSPHGRSRPTTRALVAEAQRRAIPIHRLDDSPERVELGRGSRVRRSLLQLGYGKYQRRIWAPYISTNSGIAIDIACNKELSNHLLRSSGLPVPSGAVVDNADAAAAAAERLGFPVVLKPADGNHGAGVSVDLRDRESVRAHFSLAQEAKEKRSGKVRVETYVAGRTYRALVVGGTTVAVTEQVPAHVVGDGVHTLNELVQLTNADPRRGSGYENLLVHIALDLPAIEFAREQGYTLDDVPPAGREVRLSRFGHISNGGTSVDRTEEVHPDNAAIAAQAAGVIGLDVAGIDLITPDISRSIKVAGGAICEVNAGPGLGMHLNAVEGRCRDVAGPVIELLFPQQSPSRIPIAAVTGAQGKTTTCEIISTILKQDSQSVGSSTTRGVEIAGTQLALGDPNGADSVRKVLLNPAVEAAVLEIGFASLKYSGLGYEKSDVSVVTNVIRRDLEATTGPTNKQLLLTCAAVCRSTAPDGCLVLNADDEMCLRLARRFRRSLFYFSARPRNSDLHEQLRSGDRALVLSPDGHLTLFSKIKKQPVFAIDFPLLRDGILYSRIGSVLGAAAACIALGSGPESIRSGLIEFSERQARTNRIAGV